MNTKLGYLKTTLTNTSVLLAGGGDKLLSDIVSDVLTTYTNSDEARQLIYLLGRVTRGDNSGTVYYKVAEASVTNASGVKNITGSFLVTSHYFFGILVVQGRIESGSSINSNQTFAKWVLRSGTTNTYDTSFNCENFILVTESTSNSLKCTLYFKITATRKHARFKLLDEGSWANPTHLWTLHYNNTGSTGALSSIPSETPSGSTPESGIYVKVFTSIIDGTIGSIPYISGNNVFSFLAEPTGNSLLSYNVSNHLPQWINNNYLPKTGGIIANGSDQSPLTIQRTGSTYASIKFTGGTTGSDILGYLGFKNTGDPMVRYTVSNENKYFSIAHQGNITGGSTTLNWNTEATIATIAGIDVKIKIPANPVSVMVGATDLNNGESGYVPQPVAGNNDKFLCGDGTWKAIPNIVTSSSTLTSNKIILGNGSKTVKASTYGIETSLTSTSSTALPTSKAVADYVTSLVNSSGRFKGTFNASATYGPINGGSSTLRSVAEAVGDTYICSTAGTLFSVTFGVNDQIIFTSAVAANTIPTSSDFIRIQNLTTVTNNNATLDLTGTTTIATIGSTDITINSPFGLAQVLDNYTHSETLTFPKVYWHTAPTNSNLVYGIGIRDNGLLYYIYNNKGIYLATAYSSNTWRNIYLNGTSTISTGTGTKALNFANGTNTTVTYLAAGTGTGLSGSSSYFNIKIDATDNKVTQTNTTSSSEYRLLFSNSNNDTTETAGIRKSGNLKFNPSTKQLILSSGSALCWLDNENSGKNVLTLSSDDNHVDLGYGSSLAGYKTYISGGSNIVLRTYASSQYTDRISINNSGTISITANINPKSTETYNLGSSTYKWNNVYAVNFSGKINNHTIDTDVPADAVFTDTWNPASTSQGGYVPILDLDPTLTIATQSTEYVLTYKSGTETEPVWRKLPSNAFTNTWNAMTGATSSSDGTKGYINKTPPSSGYNTKYWRADGSWSIPPVKVFVGTCNTEAATATKVVTISDTTWHLKSGVIIAVKFTYSNTASSVKLKVNSEDAISIWYSESVYTSTSSNVCGYAGRYTYYMYDGNNWCWLNTGYSLNSDTKIRVYRQTSEYNNDYPILVSRTLSIGTSGTNNSYSDVYAVINNNSSKVATFNPNTGVMKIGSNTVYHEGNLMLPRTPVLNIVPQEAGSGLPYVDYLFGTMPTYLLSFCNGRPLHNDPCFKKDTNDVQAYTLSPYTSTIYREEIGSSGEYELQVRLMNSSGSAKSLTNLGGWYFGDLCKRFTQYVCIFLANIPVGCTIEYNGNSTGGGGETKRFWLTSNEGTGKMEWYGHFLVTDAHGEDSDFSTINYYRIYNSSGLNNNAAVWVKIRYAQVFELTDGDYIGPLRSRFTDNLQRNVIIKSGTTATVQINSFEDDYVLIPDSGKTITVNINFDPVSSDVGRRITIYKPLYAGTGQLSFKGNNSTHYYYKYISSSTTTGGTVGNSNVNLGNGNKFELIYLGVINSKYYWLFLTINIG